MRVDPRLIVLVALAGASFPGADELEGQAPDPGTRPDTVRILAYNIHHGAGMDEILDLERVADLIRRVDPDLVALQEIDSATVRTGRVDQAAELGRLTGLTSLFGRFMEYQGGAYGMALLSRWPVEDFQNLRLPDGAEPRTSVAALVRSPRTGRVALQSHRRGLLQAG